MLTNIGIILIGLGILALIGWAVEGFFMAEEIPVLVKVAAGAVGVGILILLGVAIKDRISKAKTEDFKGVER